MRVLRLPAQEPSVAVPGLSRYAELQELAKRKKEEEQRRQEEVGVQARTCV